MPLVAADLIVEWDFASKRARLWPSTAQTVLWSAWYELAVVRRLPPAAFTPPPSVAGGVLRARRRTVPLVPARDARRFERFVRDGFRRDRHARWYEGGGTHSLPLTGVDEYEAETFFPMLGMALRVSSRPLR